MELQSEKSNTGVRNCKFRGMVYSMEFGEHCLGDEDIQEGGSEGLSWGTQIGGLSRMLGRAW